jgi:DegV family protein with EDD domain
MGLPVHFGDETFRSGVDLTSEQFFARWTPDSVPPKTSVPSREEFVEFYRQAAEPGTPILSLHGSGKLSQTVTTAAAAARLLPDRDIRVIDSRTVSGALGLQVLTIARAAQNGATVEQILPLLEQTYQAGSMLFCLDTLEYVHRGGRIGRVSYYVASTLRLKPIISVGKTGDSQGIIVPEPERVFSMSAAVDAIFRLMLKAVPAGSRLRAIVVYGPPCPTALVERVHDRLKNTFDCVFLTTTIISPSLGVYTGPGGFGVCYAMGDWPT